MEAYCLYLFYKRFIFINLLAPAVKNVYKKEADKLDNFFRLSGG